jgi:hypothetical protein
MNQSDKDALRLQFPLATSNHLGTFKVSKSLSWLNPFIEVISHRKPLAPL